MGLFRKIGKNCLPYFLVTKYQKTKGTDYESEIADYESRIIDYETKIANTDLVKSKTDLFWFKMVDLKQEPTPPPPRHQKILQNGEKMLKLI
jgi:hypothetical protein